MTVFGFIFKILLSANKQLIKILVSKMNHLEIEASRKFSTNTQNDQIDLKEKK